MAARSKRSATEFAFVVRYPWGTSAIEGYRRAAEHFGLCTRVDPTTDGDDVTRLLIHADAAVLARAVEGLLALLDGSDEDDPYEWPDVDLLIEAGVHWFTQDWKHWDAEQDEGVLEGLGEDDRRARPLLPRHA